MRHEVLAVPPWPRVALGVNVAIMTNPHNDASPSRPADITELARTILAAEEREQQPTRCHDQVRHPRPELLTSLRGPSLVVQVLLATWLVLGPVAFVYGLAQRSLLHRIQTNPATVTIGELSADQHRVNVINGVYVALLVATGIAFVAWFWRAYRNLDALDLPRRYGAGWAIGGWVVPFLNFVRPKQVANDIWRSVVVAKSGASDEPGGSILLGAWWLAWVGGTALVFFGRNGHERTVHDALLTNGLYLARDVVLVVGAVLAIFVVRVITRAQTPNA